MSSPFKSKVVSQIDKDTSEAQCDVKYTSNVSFFHLMKGFRMGKYNGTIHYISQMLTNIYKLECSRARALLF